MKRYICIACCVLALASTNIFAQTPSTQGKEFWVALTPSQAAGEDKPSNQDPTDVDNLFGPYIAISSLKSCTVKISNPNTNWAKIVNVNADSWTEVKDIPMNIWYTTSGIPQTESKYDLGLKIESTEEVSIFCALRWKQSFDATNILPIDALQSEYIIQTYGPTDKSSGHHSSVFTILAAEDCTIDITPSVKTKSGKAAKSSFNIQLKAGQVYHVFSDTDSNLSGSRVVARDGKKIAVFSGCPAARIPNDFSDRDLLYEQLFPIDYWGKEFIVSRSLQRDANRIIITAQEDNTQITIHGNYQATTVSSDLKVLQDFKTTLNSGESYEFEMSFGNGSKWDNNRSNFKGITIIDSTAYISATCPCAVISYDVGNGYYRKTKVNDIYTETEQYSKNNDQKNWYGAPSMTWVSPVEQMINDIVFGLMGTDKTDRHFVNIITTTDNVASMEMNGVSIESYFKPVGSNPEYSYMRYHFSTKTGFYHLHGDKGFMATVYGNGDDESYAYSVGSAAIKQGIKVGEQVLTEGIINDVSYCVGEVIEFDAQISSAYTVDEVDWDFGDGVKELNGAIQTMHQYDSPGWYDLKVNVRAHKDCPYGTYPDISINISYYVSKPDTVRMPGTHDCINENETERGVVYPFLEIREVKTDCSRVEITPVEIGVISSYTIQEDTVAYDSCYWINSWRYVSGDYTDTIPNGNYMNCDSIITRHITIVSCLGVEVEMPQAEFCADEQNITLNYKITKGDPSQLAGGYILLTSGKKIDVEISNNQITAPISEFTPGKYSCMLCLEDKLCEKKLVEIPLSFTIRYASNIFRQKWDDVLVVPNSSTNGGFEFIGYQWLKDGEEISGATTAWYYAPDYTLETKLDTAAEYSVRLMTKDSVIIESCPKKPQSIGEAEQSVRVAPTLLMPRENISIETEGEATAEIYNTLGLRESISLFKDKTEITAPREKGIYVLQVTLSNGYKTSKQIVVGR